VQQGEEDVVLQDLTPLRRTSNDVFHNQGWPSGHERLGYERLAV